jgi:hypothetical protein
MSRDPRFERLEQAIKRLIREENRHSDRPSAHHVPHDVAYWFVRLLSGDAKVMARALGVLRPRGHPVDPDKSEKVDLAEKALALQMQGKTWAKINAEIFADRSNPPDERYIRTLVTQYRPLVIVKQLRRRWLSQAEERKQRAILKNSKKGRTLIPSN